MDKRKQIIIKEIIFWKQNKMLPEKYCDYLLTLYSEGEELTSAAHLPRLHRLYRILQTILLLFIPISLFVLYFTEMPFILQMAILTIFVVLLIGAGVYFGRKGLFVQLFFLSAALIFLFFTIQINDKILSGNSSSLYLIILMNCLLWILVGKTKKLLYFTISGIAGMIITFVFILLHF
ncbi:MAG: hypothetical protein IMW92_10300 [Bacillales bacterium]|nr:hypothetical protein [Bacillales bacterium]